MPNGEPDPWVSHLPWVETAIDPWYGSLADFVLAFRDGANQRFRGEGHGVDWVSRTSRTITVSMASRPLKHYP